MSYEKRVCVLRQIKKGFTADGSALSGAVYVERLGSELTVTPRLLGIAPVKEGSYALALWIEGNVFVVDLDESASVRLETPSIRSGLAVLLVYLRGEAEPIAYGSCGLAPSDHGALLEALKKVERKRRTPPPQTKNEAPMSEGKVYEIGEDVPPFREQAQAYDDEAIAEDNYYGDAHDGDGAAVHLGGQEEAQAGGAEPAGDDEAVRPFLRTGGGLGYYNSVRERLREAFAKFGRDRRLEGVFPCSEWVKAEGALLGIVYEEGAPKYLCVAAEGSREAGPPAALAEHAMFVPETPFSDTVGFFVVFQSADTGEYVTVGEG